MDNLSLIKVGGIEFYVRDYSRPDEAVLRNNIEANNYQLPDSMHGLVVVDIGAFIGGISIMCAKRGALVYAAEPSSDNFRLLKKNIEHNNLDDMIWASHVALGYGWERNLDINTDNLASNVLEGLPNTVARHYKTEVVRVQTLKEFFKVNGIKRCDILKIDCEGAEIELLDDIAKIQPPLIVGEIHFRDVSRAFDEKLTMYDKVELGRCDMKYIRKF